MNNTPFYSIRLLALTWLAISAQLHAQPTLSWDPPVIHPHGFLGLIPSLHAETGLGAYRLGGGWYCPDGVIEQAPWGADRTSERAWQTVDDAVLIRTLSLVTFEYGPLVLLDRSCTPVAEYTEAVPDLQGMRQVAPGILEALETRSAYHTSTQNGVVTHTDLSWRRWRITYGTGNLAAEPISEWVLFPSFKSSLFEEGYYSFDMTWMNEKQVLVASHLRPTMGDQWVVVNRVAVDGSEVGPDLLVARETGVPVMQQDGTGHITLAAPGTSDLGLKVWRFSPEGTLDGETVLTMPTHDLQQDLRWGSESGRMATRPDGSFALAYTVYGSGMEAESLFCEARVAVGDAMGVIRIPPQPVGAPMPCPLQVDVAWTDADTPGQPWELTYFVGSTKPDGDRQTEAYRSALDFNAVSADPSPVARPALLRAFPNPARQSAHVVVGPQTVRLDVLDVLGRTLMTVSVPTGSDRVPIATSRLAAGTYVVRAWHADGTTQSTRLSVSH